MDKVVLFIFYFGSIFHLSAQDTLPQLKATSTSADIRVGNDYFLQGGWKLEPSKNPDIFFIGSKWPYESKKVTFITDIDSMSFDAQPGKTYDFVIMLNENTPCYSRIETSAHPIFLDTKIAVPVLLGFTIFILMLYGYRNSLNTKILLNCGYAVTILFWLMTYISGQINGQYNHVKNVISALGAIGTKSETFTSSFLMFLSLLGVLFSIGFYRVSKMKNLSVIPAVLSFVMPFTFVWAGIFTLGNEFHSAIGPIPLMIIIGSLLSYLLWRKHQKLLTLRIISLISFLTMLLIFTRFIQPFGMEYAGLVQRFFYVGWTIWTISISYHLSINVKQGDVNANAMKI